MPQDYVKRNKAKPKPRAKTTARGNQRKAAGNNAASPKLIITIILVVVIITGFALFLNHIKGRGSDAAVSPEAPQSSSASEQTEDEIPPLPDDIWEYPDDLSEPDDLPAESYEVEQKGPYLMQCGSFRTEQQAETLKAKIAFTGLESQIRRTDGSNGVWYKVILGPYERKRLAETDRHKLKSNSINYCRIWLWT